MKTQTKLFTQVIGCVLATSTVLSTTVALANPYNGNRNYGYNHSYNSRYGRDYDRYYGNGRQSYPGRSTRIIYKTNNGFNNNRPGVTVLRLPEGYRRVNYNNRVYYTRNHRDYYAYDPVRRGYVVVNLSGLNIRF